MTPPDESEEQILAISRHSNHLAKRNLNPKKDLSKHITKSPYNNNSLKNQLLKQTSADVSAAKNQGVGREILRSSQGANRRLDAILA